MEGRKRERKLISKDGANISSKEVMIEARKILKEFSPTELEDRPINSYYKDTYYDDIDSSLYESGGSLKVRVGISPERYTERSLVMRTKTRNIEKLKYNLFWDVVELPVGLAKNMELQDLLQLLKPFFADFDFEKINSTPVLICETIRMLYRLEILKDSETITISFLFDSVKYESNGKTATDNLLKIRGGKEGEKLLEKLHQDLMEKFPEYQLIQSSRYERALEKLKIL